jgi:hypothetical protein
MSMLKEASNIYEVVTPTYFILKIFGMAPFSFEGPAKLGNIKTTIFDKIYSLVIFSIFTAVVCELHNILELSSFGGKKLYTYCWIIALYYLFIIKVLHVLANFYNKKGIIEFLQSIEAADKKVSKFGLNFDKNLIILMYRFI